MVKQLFKICVLGFATFYSNIFDVVGDLVHLTFSKKSNWFLISSTFIIEKFEFLKEFACCQIQFSTKKSGVKFFVRQREIGFFQSFQSKNCVFLTMRDCFSSLALSLLNKMDFRKQGLIANLILYKTVTSKNFCKSTGNTFFQSFQYEKYDPSGMSPKFGDGKPYTFLRKPASSLIPVAPNRSHPGKFCLKKKLRILYWSMVRQIYPVQLLILQQAEVR